MKKILSCIVVLAILCFASLAMAAGDTPCVSSGLQTSSGAIVTGGGHFLCSVLIITDGTDAVTATLYDNASAASGKVIFKGTVPGASYFGVGDAGNPIAVGNGIYLSISGSTPNVIVYYR
jgi:hypothetical protein